MDSVQHYARSKNYKAYSQWKNSIETKVDGKKFSRIFSTEI